MKSSADGTADADEMMPRPENTLNAEMITIPIQLPRKWFELLRHVAELLGSEDPEKDVKTFVEKSLTDRLAANLAAEIVNYSEYLQLLEDFELNVEEGEFVHDVGNAQKEYLDGTNA